MGLSSEFFFLLVSVVWDIFAAGDVATVLDQAPVRLPTAAFFGVFMGCFSWWDLRRRRERHPDEAARSRQIARAFRSPRLPDPPLPGFLPAATERRYGLIRLTVATPIVALGVAGYAVYRGWTAVDALFTIFAWVVAAVAIVVGILAAILGVGKLKAATAVVKEATRRWHETDGSGAVGPLTPSPRRRSHS